MPIKGLLLYILSRSRLRVDGLCSLRYCDKVEGGYVPSKKEHEHFRLRSDQRHTFRLLVSGANTLLGGSGDFVSIYFADL